MSLNNHERIGVLKSSEGTTMKKSMPCSRMVKIVRAGTEYRSNEPSNKIYNY